VREGQIVSSRTDPGPLEDYWHTDQNGTEHIGRQLEVSLGVRNLFDRKDTLPALLPSPSQGDLPEQAGSVKLVLRDTC
jgi:hypothetical protein